MRLSFSRLSFLLLPLALSACADGGRDTVVLDSGTSDAARDAAQAVDAGEDLGPLPDLGDMDAGEDLGPLPDLGDVDAGEDLGPLPDLGDVDSGPVMCVSDELCDGRDNDCDGDTDEGCPASSPVNDTCAGAIALTGATGTRAGDTINGAVANTTDCSTGLDVFYRVDVAVASVVYVDTFGSSFDTVLSYRGTSCPGTASRCNDDDDCDSLQEQIGVLVSPGSHYFAVHAYSTSVTTGSVSIRWQVTAAPAGNLEVVDGSGSYSGTTSSSAGRISPTCGGGSSGFEHAYYWFQCPGASRTVSAHTCFSDYDTTLSIVGPTGTLACNDDSSDWLLCSPGSELSGITTSGAGFFAIFVDAYDSDAYGSYVLSTNL
jgi:hypothetical protein